MQSTPETYAADLRKWARGSLSWAGLMALNAILPVAMLIHGIPDEDAHTGMAALTAIAITGTCYCIRSALRAFRMAREHEAKNKAL